MAPRPDRPAAAGERDRKFLGCELVEADKAGRIFS